MKILYVIPSSMQWCDSYIGLVTGALSLATSLHKVDKGVSVDLLGDWSTETSIVGFGAVSVDLRVSRHQVALFKKILEVSDDYDIIHLHANMYMQAGAYKNLSSIADKIVLTVHSPLVAGITAHAGREGYLNALDKFTVSVPSSTAYKLITDYYEIDPSTYNVNVISNIVDDFGFSDNPEDIICIVARIDPNKNPVFNIKTAINDAMSSGFKVKLIANVDSEVNKTASAKHTVSKVLELVSSTDKVELVSSLDRAGIGSLLRSSKAVYHFVNTGSQEMVPIEAASTGTPFVYFSDRLPHFLHSPCPSYVSKELSRKDNRDGLSGVLDKCLSVSRTSMREYYDKNYSENSIVSKWLSLYNSVV